MSSSRAAARVRHQHRDGRAGPTDRIGAAVQASLAVSVVVYQPDIALLARTLASLAAAADAARSAGLLGALEIALIDNDGRDAPAVDAAARSALGTHASALRVRRGHGNVGYGRGHNLAIRSNNAAYHLVLNPDVELAHNALWEAIAFMQANRRVGLLTPYVEGPSGEWQPLARRHPTVAALALRGFMPKRVRQIFDGYLTRYELRDRIHPGSDVVYDIPCATGCFMFARGSTLRHVGGFHPAYFLYFEDYDLALSLATVGVNAYVARVRVRHHGGDAARKGLRHTRLFARSAATFFNRHGWRVL